jgi:hypothetical protein
MMSIDGLHQPLALDDALARPESAGSTGSDNGGDDGGHGGWDAGCGGYVCHQRAASARAPRARRNEIMARTVGARVDGYVAIV